MALNSERAQGFAGAGLALVPGWADGADALGVVTGRNACWHVGEFCE
jgi:hypothetical protein